jgi:hypothetical protein
LPLPRTQGKVRGPYRLWLGLSLLIGLNLANPFLALSATYGRISLSLPKGWSASEEKSDPTAGELSSLAVKAGQNPDKILISLCRHDKTSVLELARRFYTQESLKNPRAARLEERQDSQSYAVLVKENGEDYALILGDLGNGYYYRAIGPNSALESKAGQALLKSLRFSYPK